MRYRISAPLLCLSIAKCVMGISKSKNHFKLKLHHEN